MIQSVQKQVGLLISIVGIVVIVTNFIKIYEGSGSIIYTISDISVWLLLLNVLPFIISIFLENRFLKIVQIFFILLAGVINIMDDYSEFYGPGLFLTAWLLMRHYGFMDNYRKTKYISFLFILVVLSQLSAFRHNEGTVYAGMLTLEYAVFIVAIVIIVWKDMIIEQKKLRVENRSLKINYSRIRDQLVEIEQEQKPYNLKSVKITPAEERVIKTLTIYKASNREIAERLNIAEPTVKLHLYNIYNKIGVDNRFAIIDLCKYNYT